MAAPSLSLRIPVPQLIIPKLDLARVAHALGEDTAHGAGLVVPFLKPDLFLKPVNHLCYLALHLGPFILGPILTTDPPLLLRTGLFTYGLTKDLIQTKILCARFVLREVTMPDSAGTALILPITQTSLNLVCKHT